MLVGSGERAPDQCRGEPSCETPVKSGGVGATTTSCSDVTGADHPGRTCTSDSFFGLGTRGSAFASGTTGGADGSACCLQQPGVEVGRPLEMWSFLSPPQTSSLLRRMRLREEDSYFFRFQMCEMACRYFIHFVNPKQIKMLHL